MVYHKDKVSDECKSSVNEQKEQEKEMVKIDLSGEREFDHELNMEHEPPEEPMLVQSNIASMRVTSLRAARTTTAAIV
ncbi:unnamed protein product [Onchocerca flexuosa]|uniref:Ovule protein n=1 Tax=Onchocerca flexuosa TaxID=387005 RepID=A0A183I5Q4_9BILA|nr:unnamed protein product [Onchocerca flexuosa]